MRLWLLSLSLLLSWISRSAVAEDLQEPEQPLELSQATQRPTIDGVLDDEIWRQARFVAGFTQRSPSPGAPPPALTSVAVAYDQQALYVAFRCQGAPAVGLSVRDELPAEVDYVMVYIDGALDRQTARLFAITASGVRADGTLAYDSPNRDHSWDARWDGAVQRREQAWSAELAIPLQALGIARSDPTIGIHFRRYHAVGAIYAERQAVPHTSATFVSHFETVGPLRGVEASHAVELQPYLRLDLRPRIAAGSGLRDDPVRFGAGVALRVGLAGDLGLFLAALPDFGETEIDPAVLNLSAYETVFAEQRQIFLEEADLFRFPSLSYSWTWMPFQLVHTRRIGAAPEWPDVADDEEVAELDDVVPVEALLRLAGQAREGTEIGLITALTGPAQAVITGPAGDRTITAAERRYYAAARLRQRLGRSRSTIGAALTATGELDELGEYALAMDLDVHPATGHHRLLALGAASIVDGELGWAINTQAGREGGPGFRWRLVGLAESDRFDVNGLGWYRRNDRAGWQATAGWMFDDLGPPFQQIQVALLGEAQWSFDGLAIGSGEGIWAQIGIWERDSVWTYVFVTNPHWDDLETRGGPALHRPVEVYGETELRTALARSIGCSIGFDGSASRHGNSLGVSGELRWTPARIFRLTLTGRYARRWDALLWLDDLADGEPGEGEDLPLLARLDLDLFQVSLRSTLAFTATLSVQAYVQLLATAGDYVNNAELVEHELLPREAPAEYDFDSVVLLANVVLRWEPRPGLVLYGVYTHSGEGSAETGRLQLARHLDEAAWSQGSDLFLIKLELTLG